MLRLKANKTSLYKLVRSYESLPPMRRACFTKTPRAPTFWLTWTDDCGLCGEAFLSACGGKPLLSITRREFCGEDVSRDVHTLDLSDLRERGMVEVFITPAERRRLNAEQKKAPSGSEDPPGADKPRGLP